MITMKIAYLAKDYPPYGQSFATALYYPELASALSLLGHDVHIISQAPQSKDERTKEGVNIHWVGPAPKSGSGLTRMRYNLAAWLKLKELHKRNYIEIAEAPIFFGDAFLPSLWSPVPLVVQTFAFTDMFLKTKSYSGIGEHLSFKLSALLENTSLMRADRIIANSPQTYRYLIDEKKLPTSKIHLVWESRIDLEKFKYTPSDIKTRLGIADVSPLILYVGWLQARKGVHILCEAIPDIVRQFPQATVVLLGRDTNSAPGGGSFKEYLLKQAGKNNCGPNIKLIDTYIPNDEMAELYSACDLFVLPSLSETFGWPVIEAMACQRPVVATATGIATEFGDRSQALALVPIGDKKALARAIIKILSMPKEEREIISAAHRQIVEENFSFQKMTDCLIKVYQETIEKHRKN